MLRIVNIVPPSFRNLATAPPPGSFLLHRQQKDDHRADELRRPQIEGIVEIFDFRDLKAMVLVK